MSNTSVVWVKDQRFVFDDWILIQIKKRPQPVKDQQSRNTMPSFETRILALSSSSDEQNTAFTYSSFHIAACTALPFSLKCLQRAWYPTIFEQSSKLRCVFEWDPLMSSKLKKIDRDPVWSTEIFWDSLFLWIICKSEMPAATENRVT